MRAPGLGLIEKEDAEEDKDEEDKDEEGEEDADLGALPLGAGPAEDLDDPGELNAALVHPEQGLYSETGTS